MRSPSFRFFFSVILSLILLCGCAAAETITVGYSGNTGTYTVDGTNDQNAINSALSYAHSHGTAGNPVVVQLKGSHTYSIRDQIFIGSNTILTAESGVVLKVPDGALGTTTSNCVLPDGQSLIDQMSGVIPQNVEIYGFTIDGNCDQQDTDLGIVHPGTSSEKVQSAGSGVERIIEISGSSTSSMVNNISVHNIIFKDAFGEALHMFYGNDIQFYNCDAENMQHDDVFLIEVTNANIHNCNFKAITDGAVRLDNCRNVKVHDCTISPYRGSNNNGAYIYGANGFQIANEGNKPSLTDNIEIYNNVLNNIDLCGIWINDQKKTAGTANQDIFIHHNTFNNNGAQGSYAYSVPISIYPWGNGVAIENNTFNYSNQNAVQMYSSIANTTFSVGIKNNNFLYTQDTGTGLTSTYRGYDIYNRVPTYLVGAITGNYFYGADKGPVYPTTLLHTNDATSLIAGAGGNGSSATPDDTPINRTSVTINGYIYDSSLSNPIKNAVVYVMNGSWSESQVTNAEGYYEFDVQSNTGVYYLSATATDYISSISASGSGLPINLTSSSYGLNIALTKNPTYYNPHFVTFTVVKPFFGTTFEGVNVTVYSANDETIIASQLTDSYGRATFRLEEDQKYRITFIDDIQNINMVRTVMPVETEYKVFSYFGKKVNNSLSDQELNLTDSSDYIGYGISNTELNTTYGYINQTILSKTNDSVTYTSTIKQVDSFGSETGNFSNTTNGTTTNVSFAIAVPNGHIYSVVTTVNHPAYVHTYINTIETKSSGVRPEFDFGWEDQWNYEVLGYVLVLLVGGLFGQRNMKGGILSVLGIALFNQYVGWWQYDVTGLIFLSLALLLGFGYIVTRED